MFVIVTNVGSTFTGTLKSSHEETLFAEYDALQEIGPHWTRVENWNKDFIKFIKKKKIKSIDDEVEFMKNMVESELQRISTEK
jgi:hypothetical protein